ncbi:MAG: FAD-binding oxidoreductase [Candidatus Velthaea sp.]
MIATRDYALSDRVPVRIEEPPDAAGVATMLERAAHDGAAVVAFGGATLQSIGNAPVRYDVALSVRGLDRVLAYDARDLTIGLEAGATLENVSRVLAASNQFLPFDAPHPKAATAGGTLAAGWVGPRSAAYGRLRDLLIGSTAALADGTLATAGGMVVKNVTGYDMSKLYVGSLGTLGVLVRANFKALPRAAARRLAVAPLPDDVRERAIAAVFALPLEPVAALVTVGFFSATPRVRDEDARLAVLFEGSDAVIERATRELRSALGAAGVAQTVLLDEDPAEAAFQRLIDAYVENVDDRSITYRSAGLPSNAWARASAARRIAAACAVACEAIVDLRTGAVVMRMSGRTREAIAAALARLDGELRRIVPRVNVLAGDPALRAGVDAWGAPPGTLDVMRDLKRRFDPAAILAPGRYVGGI